MIKLHSKNMSPSFRIFLALISMAVILVAITHIVHVLSYNGLKSVARTLPAYNGVEIVSGEPSERECYVTIDKHDCKALTVKLTDGHDTITETNKFIDNTKNIDIEWPQQKDNKSYFVSSIFSNEGNKYQIYINHSSNDTWVSLIEH